MPMTHPIDRLADDEAIRHQALIERYAADDGMLDPQETQDVLRSARELRKYTHATHCSNSVATAVRRATGGRRMRELVVMAQMALDELPDAAA